MKEVLSSIEAHRELHLVYDSTSHSIENYYCHITVVNQLVLMLILADLHY